MTNEQAIAHFKEQLEVFGGEHHEAMKVAIEALEKMNPKKPIVWENKSYDSPVPNDDWGYECPYCGDRDIDYPEHHCECGQALSWEV